MRCGLRGISSSPRCVLIIFVAESDVSAVEEVSLFVSVFVLSFALPQAVSITIKARNNMVLLVYVSTRLYLLV